MRQTLKLHPDSHCTAATQVEAEVARPRSAGLVLHYFVTGDMDGLRVPPATTPKRSDELWRHTCFEAFVRAPTAGAYYEFNFAPSMEWAAYRFSGYRSAMTVARGITAPHIETLSNAGGYELRARMELDQLASLPNKGAWELGLSAVIEETSGVKSYWALTHPPGRPDFHHSDCFAHQISAENQQ